MGSFEASLYHFSSSSSNPVPARSSPNRSYILFLSSPTAFDIFSP